MNYNITSAIQLNNDGVRLLQEGEYKQSISTMSRSLKTLKLWLHSAEQADSKTGEVGGFAKLREVVVVEADSSKGSQPSLHDTMAFVCDRSGPIDASGAQMLGSSIIYNIAVAYSKLHDAAADSKAERLYMSVLKLLRQRNASQPNRMSVILHFAALRNLKFLLHGRCDYGSGLIRALDEEADQIIEQTADFLLDPLIEYLVLCITLTQPPTSAAAA